MGCCSSIKKVDPDRIHSPIVLHTNGECCRYHGTTERGRLQVYISMFFYFNNL